MSLERVAAATLDDAALADLFNRGYSGYYTPVRVTAEQLAAMVSLQDLDREASPVLLVDGAPAAFAFLGVRGRRGWIGGMGVAPEHRGSGLGRVAMEAALERATALGLESVDLEVLEQNTPAARIYQAIGFRERRRLEVWERPAAPGSGATETPEPMGAPRDGIEIETLDTPAFRRRCAGLVTSPPPWQRGDPVIDRVGDALRGFVATFGGRPSAGVLAKPDAARTSLMALVSDPGAPPSARRAAVVASLAAHPSSAGFVLNLPQGDPFAGALEALGFVVSHRQHEMTWSRAT